MTLLLVEKFRATKRQRIPAHVALVSLENFEENLKKREEEKARARERDKALER